MEDSAARVRNVLRRRFGAIEGELEPLAGGEFSRAFGFVAGGRAYVARFSRSPHAAEVYAKDTYAGAHFAAPGLPIPRLLATGAAEGGWYAIGERAAGRRVKALGREARAALVPSLLATLDAIAGADLGATRGYGHWDGATGDGALASWHAFLATTLDNRDAGFYRDWHALARTSFLEWPVCEAVFRRMMALAAHCPEERALVHGDLHFDNILADAGRVSGVIDWGNALYGDPLYDVAWFGRWNTAAGPILDPAILRARYGHLPAYDARIACYELYLGLDDLRFYARTDRRADYAAMRDHLLARLAADAT